MRINELFLTNNDCYKSAIIKPKGIIVHSTGANNPNLRRYVQPDDGLLGVNKYNNHWNRHGIDKCVHAMIGLDKNGEVRTYQTLPWENCAWGVGRGKKGSYNYSPTGYIQFEICEDNLKDIVYFNKVFTEAAYLCAYLCKLYALPISEVISHHEAYIRGYASAHGDCDHWLARFGYDMDWFRERVRIAYNSDNLAFLIPEQDPKEYVTVAKGDSLSKIAKKANITLAKIKNLNPDIKAPLYIIRPGQKVRIK